MGKHLHHTLKRFESQLLVARAVPVNDEKRLNQPSALSVIRMKIQITGISGLFVSAKKADVGVSEKDSISILLVGCVINRQILITPVATAQLTSLKKATSSINQYGLRIRVFLKIIFSINWKKYSA